MDGVLLVFQAQLLGTVADPGAAVAPIDLTNFFCINVGLGASSKILKDSFRRYLKTYVFARYYNQLATP